MNTKFNASNENDWDLDEIVKDVKTHVEMFKSTIPKHRVQPGEGSDLDSVLNESAANIVRKTPKIIPAWPRSVLLVVGSKEE